MIIENLNLFISMNEAATKAIFLITGLITATGTNPNHPTLAKARSHLEEEQYEAAIFTAEQIVEHYPDTRYASSAKKLIQVARRQQLKHEYRLN